LARSGVITEDEIQLRTLAEPADMKWSDVAPLEEGLKANVAVLEKALIERALRQAQGNKTRAAEILGVHRRLLYEKIREYGLEAG
jgi:DNA-binding NtrC family response regulator